MTVARRTWLLKCSRENLETTRKRVAMRYQEEVGLVKVEEPEVLVEDIRNYPKEIPIPDLFSKETRKEE